MRSKPHVAVEVAALGDLSREELVERWQKIYGTPPPKGVRQELMLRAVAWHLQAKRLGGFSAETRRLLKVAIGRVEAEMRGRTGTSQAIRLPEAVGDGGRGNANDPASEVVSPTSLVSAPIGPSLARQRRQLHPGARLLREWNGKTHVVDVIEGGYVYEAKVYPSLSAIAGEITGAHWSGPRFFGL